MELPQGSTLLIADREVEWCILNSTDDGSCSITDYIHKDGSLHQNQLYRKIRCSDGRDQINTVTFAKTNYCTDDIVQYCCINILSMCNHKYKTMVYLFESVKASTWNYYEMRSHHPCRIFSTGNRWNKVSRMMIPWSISISFTENKLGRGK